ncbi:MAG: DNA polymerase III subunit delta [Bacillota bacterium]|nr:DNA polymerase III subunit delta [Bacillota bacterium]
MIELKTVKDKSEKGEFYSFYIFMSTDQGLIKEEIDTVINKNIDKDSIGFNLEKLDGGKVSFEDIKNSCETFPMFSGKKVVLIYNADFLKNKDKKSEKTIKELGDYINNLPDNLILIMYFLVDSDREKVNPRLLKLSDKGAFIKVSKVTGLSLNKKAEELFKSKNKKIGKAELSYFCQRIQNDISSIKNEINKLTAYTEGRDITKDDIEKLIPGRIEDDIFSLTNAVLYKKTGLALSILSDLTEKGEKPSVILYMIEKQYKNLLDVIILLKDGKDSNYITNYLNLNRYVCEKIIASSRSYNKEQLLSIINLCLKTEKDIKSKGVDAKSELEFMIINLAYIK